MYSYRFKTGVFTIEVETPEPLSLDEHYSLFLSDDEKADIYFSFNFVPNLPDCLGKAVSDNWRCDIFDDGIKLSFFYKDFGENKYYACREINKSDYSRQYVFLPDRYKGKLLTRTVFDLIGTEDIAALHFSSIFHASYVDLGEAALLFTAPPGTGKSTQADLWYKHMNTEIINGDKVLLYADDNGSYAHGLPFSGSSKICKNRSLKIKAIVRLGQAPENKIRRLKGLEAYKAVFEGCYQSMWSDKLSENISSLVEKTVKTTPIFWFDCVPDKTAVQMLESELRKL